MAKYTEFKPLSRGRSKPLDILSTKFQILLERLQSPVAKEGMKTAFHATTAALGRAAAKAARRRR